MNKKINPHSVPHNLHRNNTSGITGVYWRKDKKRYGIIIYRKGKKIYLGTVSSLMKAKERIREYDNKKTK